MPSDLDEVRRMFDQFERRADERFDKLKEGQDAIAVKLDDVAELAHELEQEVGGAPRVGIRRGRLTMRERIHNLENDRAAANAARAALDAAQAVKNESWSRRQKIGLFIFAGGGFVIALIELALTH